MADRPILFSAPMVRALLDGTKTQTRRVLKPAKYSFENNIRLPDGANKGEVNLPSINVGDRLYVRETWRAANAYDDLSPSAMGGEESIRYEADNAWQTWGWPIPIGLEGRFRQAMHMPRWASRITLTVTEVRVQRLQECSEADAKAEGAQAIGSENGPDPDERSHLWGYFKIWEEINGEGSWALNPWVAAYSFTVQRGNIDQVAA